MQNTRPRDPYITLVGKVVRIIEVLRDAPDGLTLKALAAKAGCVKSSAHRILLSLRKHGYVQQDEPGGRYRLGLKFLAVGRAANGSVSLVQAARSHLGELTAAFEETVYLAVLRGERGVFVDVHETSRDLRLVGPLGAEVHFHATAAGKAMAASLPQERRGPLLARLALARLTARTLTSRAEVNTEWDRVRRRGVAINQEETIVGAIFLAAPIFDAKRHVCGAISIGIPKARYTGTQGRAMADALKDTCARLSDTLALSGYIHPTAPDGSRERSEAMRPTVLAG
jgi:IclR family acetate operon transcriptional repressor